MTIKELYNIFTQSECIVTDTRTIIPNSLFFALKGSNFNGNLFAEEALAKDAKYAIVDEDVNSSDPRIIKVDDTLSMLQKLANYHRKQLNIPVIGVTGTNGKTTTKELLLATLSKKYNTIATEGNLNNHIGVPISLLKIKSNHEIAIIEMGANHLNEIAELCEIAEPNFGIVTNVGKAHLEGFISFENIIRTKSDLYKYVKTANGINFILKENTKLSPFVKDSDFIEYSCKDSNSPNYGKGDVKNSFLEFTLKKLENTNIDNTIIKTKMVGLYNQSNILAAITISHYFGVPLEQIQIALENYTPSNNRSQLEETTKNKLILDAYNANPTSVLNALDNFEQINHSKKLIILADMLELGEFAQKEHQEIIKQLSSKNTKAILIGPEFSKTSINSTDSKLITKFSSTQELIDSDILNTIEKSLILIKGSRGMRLEQLVKYL